LAKERSIGGEIKLLQSFFVGIKIRCSRVVAIYCCPMFSGPFLVAYLCFRNFLTKASLIYRYGNPLNAIVCFDFVPISPVVFCVLDFVINNKFIDSLNNIKVSFPRNVIGLKYCYFFQGVKIWVK
jgi:hypothetical protein